MDCEDPEKEESTRDADIAPRGKFVLNQSLGAPTSDKDVKPAPFSFNFANSVKAAEKGEELKYSTNIYDKLGNQVKMFANKNLFSNPMVKQLPPVKGLEVKEKTIFNKGPTMKTEANDKRKSFIQANPLNSEHALRMK